MGVQSITATRHLHFRALRARNRTSRSRLPQPARYWRRSLDCRPASKRERPTASPSPPMMRMATWPPAISVRSHSPAAIAQRSCRPLTPSPPAPRGLIASRSRSRPKGPRHSPQRTPSISCRHNAGPRALSSPEQEAPLKTWGCTDLGFKLGGVGQATSLTVFRSGDPESRAGPGDRRDAKNENQPTQTAQIATSKRPFTNFSAVGCARARKPT